ncbi:MAG: Lrp/AsnC family transcriptional regulator [Pseudomonadota bacterium]
MHKNILKFENDDELDSYDLAILSELGANADLTTIELSERVHLSRTAVARRITHLRDKQVIGRARVEIPYEKLGVGVRALVEISAPKFDTFEVRDKVLERPEVLGVSVVLGGNLLVADVVAFDTGHLHSFLTWLGDMSASQTYVVLKQHESRMPLRERLKRMRALQAEPDTRLIDRSANNGDW